MGDIQNTGRHQGGADAVEGVITHGPENAVHRRSPARRAVDHRVVRALWRLPEDLFGAPKIGVITVATSKYGRKYGWRHRAHGREFRGTWPRNSSAQNLISWRA